MDPALLCKVFFNIGTAVDIGGTLIPSFREQIMNYGSRGMKPQKSEAKDPKPRSKLASLFDYVASIKIPHTWFTHYYIVSVASSIFWGIQIATRGRAFECLVTYSKGTPSTMTINQIFLAWSLMTIQGTRRLAESIIFTKPSQSKMWFGLWILGIAYYVFMGISVWIEGTAALTQPGDIASRLQFSSPSLKTSVALPIFVVASATQYICHKHLASLKKYTLPQHPLFKSIICPHYISECMIYLAIAIIAAPGDQLLNKTVLAGLGFVASNLAVTADSTRKWYVEKFGEKEVEGRWRMAPYLY